MADFDIVVIGAGSGNALIGGGFPGKKAALVDVGVPFGGTCLNKGCIPSKMLAHVGHTAEVIRGAARLGLKVGPPQVDWPAIQRRVFGRTDAVAREGLESRELSQVVTLYRGFARFASPHSLEVSLHDGSSTLITGQSIVIATGARPVVPEVPGLDDPRLAGRIFTSDDIMRIGRLPKSLAIVGGSIIAVEFADLFASLGVQVTVIQRSTLLRRADQAVSEAVTAELAPRVRLRLNQQLAEVEPADSGPGMILYTTDADGVEYHYTAEALLLAVGRRPNTDGLRLEAAGLATQPNGQLAVDAYLRTNVPHIWALGDVDSPEPLKHVANHEARVVRHNLEDPKHLIEVGQRPIPTALFTTPQVAWVGATEQALRDSRRPYVSAVYHVRDVAQGWAMEDSSDHHFVKVLADPATGQLLGAHIVAPEAALLLQPLVQAMTFGLDLSTMARSQYWPHPGLQEVVENALLALDLPEPEKKRKRWGR